MSSYQNAVRKSIRWYHKVAEELIFGTAVVNARILYNEYNKSVPGFRPMSVLLFKEMIVSGLLGILAPASAIKAQCSKKQHALVQFTERDNRNRVKRKMCIECYAKLKQRESRDAARKKHQKGNYIL